MKAAKNATKRASHFGSNASFFSRDHLRTKLEEKPNAPAMASAICLADFCKLAPYGGSTNGTLTNCTVSAPNEKFGFKRLVKNVSAAP